MLGGHDPYGAEILAALPNLRCISRCGVGTDAIDLAAARRRNIAVLTTHDEIVEPVAELAVTMILSLARNLPVHSAELRAGEWRRHPAYLVSEWTLGLVGFGRVGRAVAKHLSSFGPRIIVADPKVSPHDFPEGVELTDLWSLLAEADLVSIHADRRPEEGPLIGGRELATMKAGSRLLNTSRGYLVDEAALYEALQSGHLAGAALDVFQEEPYSRPLTMLPQVLCTPHTGSLTRASRRAMELRCAENVVAFLTQEELGSAAVPPQIKGAKEAR